MSTTLKNLTKLATLVLATGLVFGCASTSDLQRVEAKADQAQASANNAQATADQALAAANNAQICCDQNKDAISRAFQRSMMK